MSPADTSVLDPTVGWIVLVSLSVFWVLLGWYWSRKASELDDYVLAGRKVGLALAVATVMATWVTSNTTLVAPQLAYQLGIWGMLGYSLGAVGLLLFAPMASRIRKLMPEGYTSGDFIRLRYGNTAWRVFLVISLFYCFGWLVSMGMAGGILIEALTGIGYLYGMTVILFIVTGYTVLGGFRAVLTTDYMQVLMILVGLVVIGWLAIDNLGTDEIHQTVSAQRPQLLNLLMPAAIMFLFNNLLFGIGEIFHSNVWWSRAFAFREDVGFKAYLISGLLWAPIPIVAGFIALAAPAMGLNVPAADMVGPMISAEILGTSGAVLVLVVVYAALASSLAALLAATSTLIVEDIYRRHLVPKATQQHLRRAASVIILLLGIATWGLCAPHFGTLAEVLNLAGAFVASTIWPIVAGLYWRRANTYGAIAALAIGSAAGLTSYFLIGWYTAALASAFVSMVIVLLSTWAKPGDFNWDNLNEARPRDEAS